MHSMKDSFPLSLVVINSFFLLFAPFLILATRKLIKNMINSHSWYHGPSPLITFYSIIYIRNFMRVDLASFIANKY